MEAFEKIIFQEKEFLLIGNKDEGGPIATKEQYESGEVSYAHLWESGEIIRFGEQIGVLADITFTAEFIIVEEPDMMDQEYEEDYQNFLNKYGGFRSIITLDDLIGMSFGITIIDPFRTEDTEQAIQRAKDYIAGYLPGKKEEENND